MLRIATIFGLIACVTIVGAFTSFDPGPSPLPEDPDDRGVFRFAIPNDPGSMDPGRTSASTDFRVVKCLYEPLLVVKWGGDGIEPGTAEAMPTISEDGLTYTFKIRKDAKWSDGKPVTAEDFVFAWRRAMIKETAGKYDSLFDVIAGVKDFKKWRNALISRANLDAVLEEEKKEAEKRAEAKKEAEKKKEAEEKEEKEKAENKEGNSAEPGGDGAADQSPKESEKEVKEEAEEEEAPTPFLEKYPGFEALLEKSPAEKWDLTLKRFDEMVGIKALEDNRTLVVTLAAPAAYFADLTAFPTFAPLPKHVLDPLAKIDRVGWYLPDAYFGDPDQLVVNGPYNLTEWRHKVRMVFDQNPHYWNKDAMGNIRVVQETIPDPNLQFLRYEEGLLDWIPDVGGIKQKLLEKKRESQKDGKDDFKYVHIIPNAGTYYYEFNCREKLPNGVPNPMTDPLVRRAMGMCINRKQIVESVTKVNEPIALLMVPDKEIPGYTGPAEAGLPFDPAAAKKLLAEAGYPGGKGMPPITITVNNDAGPGHANIALPIKKAWEDHLGLKVNLEQIEFKVLLERSTKGNYYTRRAGWFGDYADPTTWLDMYRVGDSNNDCKYVNEEYDALLKQAALELDKAKRFEILAKAEAILLQDAPIVPIFYYATVTIYDEDKIDLRQNAWNNLRLELIPIKRRPSDE